MKKRIVVLLVALLTLLSLVACQSQEDKYKSQVKAFKKVEVAEINSMIEEKKDFNLYIGRENCPYCLILAPQLEELVKNEKIEVYYLDTVNTTDEMDNFFREYKLEYVPSLLVFSGGNAEEVALDHQSAKVNGKYDINSIKEKLK